MDLSMAIIWEIFCSLHMSLFFLYPLAKLNDPDQASKTFIKYFIIRAVILFIGNFINPNIAILDFFTIFIGVLIVFPAIEKKKGKKSIPPQTKFTITPFAPVIQPTKNIDFEKLGISNKEILKDELYEIFEQYKFAYANFDYNTLENICTSKFFYITSNKLSELKSLNRKQIYENISKINIEIDGINLNKNILDIHTIIEISLNNYIIDKNGNFVKGNKYSKSNQKFKVIFERVLNESKTVERCPNCGAPLDKFKGKCEYCGSTISNPINWKINFITQIEERKIYENNPIRMH